MNACESIERTAREKKPKTGRIKRPIHVRAAQDRWKLRRRRICSLCKCNDFYSTRQCFNSSIADDQPETTFDQRKSVGYESAKCCRSIFTIIRQYCRSDRNKVALIAFFSLVCVFSVFVDYPKVDGYYPIYLLITNALLSGTIIYFFCIADSLDNTINRFSAAFPSTENYTRLCDILVRWGSFPPKIMKKQYDTKGNNKVAGPSDSNADAPRKKREFRFTAFACWIGFLLFWMGMTGYAIFIIAEETVVCKHFSGIIAMILFGFSMLLQSQGFYHSILRLAVYRKMTELPNREELEKYPYNKEHPSQTSGFVQLQRFIQEHSTIYLTVASLFLLTFVIFIHLRVPREALDLSKNYHLLITFIGVFLFTFLSTIIISFAPKIMLRQMLNTWIDESRREFEAKLNSTKTKEKDSGDLIQKINCLKEEVMEIKDDNIKTIIAVINVLAPVITYIATIADIHY